MAANHPQTAVSLMSGYSAQSDPAQSAGASARRILWKPFSPSALLGAVRETLLERQPPRP